MKDKDRLSRRRPAPFQQETVTLPIAQDSMKRRSILYWRRRSISPTATGIASATGSLIAWPS